jgi:ATP-binding cassette subfamily G (WHITE) protein 2 (SNQ2)
MIDEREAFMKETEMETGRREDFVEAVQSEKRRGVSHKSVYTVSFFTQVRTLAVRQ